ncbi:MAG: tRNA dihydrouridine synthase [Marinifilaceae bacterium]
MKNGISLAPLQGYTDWVFREAYAKYIGAVDEFYSPYLVLQNDGSLKTSHRREVEPFEERSKNLIPQVLGGNGHELEQLVTYLYGLGYQKVNLNLGCPYPMVARKGRGSGLLPFPDRIQSMLEENLDRFPISFSVKMRLGYENDEDFTEVIKVLNQFPLDEIIVHPRFGKQLYKGSVNLDRFEEILELSKHPVAYNGDICSADDFYRLNERFPSVTHWMVGRGILEDLWLPLKMRGNNLPDEESRLKILMAFHDKVYSLYAGYLNGDAQLLMKLKPFWEYFSNHFSNSRKVFKGVKKANSIDKYHQAVGMAFNEYGVEGVD